MTGKLLCIIPGPSKVLAEQPDGERWCFACRKRLPHTYQLLGDAEPGWYEPIWVRTCSSCGGDHTTFPGTA